jgi:ribose/xylose/arabinose/galactoside ABC-type transport system permease subunit
MWTRHRREISIAIASLALGLALAIAAPGYFSRENITDLLLANLPVLLIALGMTLVILTGEIDISVGSTFAICAVTGGVLAKAGAPVAIAAAAACAVGALVGALNGWLVAYVRMPSIVVTLAVMTVLREGLRWITQGAWVENLPPSSGWGSRRRPTRCWPSPSRRPSSPRRRGRFTTSPLAARCTRPGRMPAPRGWLASTPRGSNGACSRSSAR